MNAGVRGGASGFLSPRAPVAPATPPVTFCPSVRLGFVPELPPPVFVPASTRIPFGGSGAFPTVAGFKPGGGNSGRLIRNLSRMRRPFAAAAEDKKARMRRAFFRKFHFPFSVPASYAPVKPPVKTTLERAAAADAPETPQSSRGLRDAV
jgi:hypothetical protein